MIIIFYLQTDITYNTIIADLVYSDKNRETADVCWSLVKNNSRFSDRIDIMALDSIICAGRGSTSSRSRVKAFGQFDRCE